MSHSKDAGKVGGDRINGANQAIAPGFVLGAEAFIDDKKL